MIAEDVIRSGKKRNDRPRTATLCSVLESAALRQKKAPFAITTLPASIAETMVMREKTCGTRKNDPVQMTANILKLKCSICRQGP